MLGKVQPGSRALLYVNIPPPPSFPKVSVRKPFFFSSSSFFFSFCSYQFKHEQWIPQALQECDKVSTKPTRKVMYGQWSAAPINHKPELQRMSPATKSSECQLPASSNMHTPHPPPSSTLDGWHLSPLQTNWPTEGLSSFPSTIWAWIHSVNS